MAPDEHSATSFRFSTWDARPADAAASWNYLFGRSVSRRVLAPGPGSDAAFHMEMSAHVLGDPTGRFTGSVMRTAVTTGAVARRTPELLTDGNDDVVLHLQTTGHRVVLQRGREAAVSPGGGVITTNAETSTIMLPGPGRFACIAVPRKLIAARVPRVDDMVARTLPPDAGALRLLSTYLGVLEDEEALRSPGLRTAVATHIYDLCALAVGAARDAAEVAAGRGLRAARLHALKQDITAHLAHGGVSEVSADALARRHGVTPRYVHMLFESEGTTLSRFKLGLRLARVHDMLSDAAHDELTIGAIAYRAGFTDLSTFNREFRRHFGATPTEIRSTAGRRGFG